MRQKHHRNTHTHVWSLGWSYSCAGCSPPKDHPSGLKSVHAALRCYMLWLMSASPEKRAPSSNSHKGTIWATMAQVVEIHFSHPGNIESKITPIESQAVVFTITFSRHSLLKSSDTSVWSTLIGTFLVIRIGTGNIRHPKEFERTNPQESSEKKLGTGLTTGWSSPSGRPKPAECLDHSHIFIKHSLSALFVVWRTNTRISARSKTFIESSQLRSGIGTGLTLRAHRTSDDFTSLCQEFTWAFARVTLVSLPLCTPHQLDPQARDGDMRSSSPGFCWAAYASISASFKFLRFIFFYSMKFGLCVTFQIT